MRSEVLDLMRRHGCFQGLEDEALVEIAEHMELVQCKPNECLHPPNTPLTDIYFVVQGTLKATRPDLQGNERVLWVFSRDDQIGAVMAGEVSIPEGLFAVTDCTLLKLDYKKALSLTPKYPKFRINLLQAAVRNFRQNFIEEKSRPQPWVVAVFHSSPATRLLTQRLTRRLVELGEQPRVLSDQNEEECGDNAGYRALSKGNCELFISEIREQIGRRQDVGRLFIDVDAALDPERASQLIELSDSVMWCLHAGDEKSAVERLKANCVHASSCREKINLVWLLADGCRMSPFAPELNELVSRDFKVTFSETQSLLGKTGRLEDSEREGAVSGLRPLSRPTLSLPTRKHKERRSSPPRSSRQSCRRQSHSAPEHAELPDGPFRARRPPPQSQPNLDAAQVMNDPFQAGFTQWRLCFREGDLEIS